MQAKCSFFQTGEGLQPLREDGRHTTGFLWVSVTSASSTKAPVSQAICSFHPLQGHILAVTTTSGVVFQSPILTPAPTPPPATTG